MGAGQLMARASTDVTALETALSPLPWAIQSAAMFVCGVIVLAFVQPLLAAAVAVVVGAGIAYGLWRARALYPGVAARCRKHSASGRSSSSNRCRASAS